MLQYDNSYYINIDHSKTEENQENCPFTQQDVLYMCSGNDGAEFGKDTHVLFIDAYSFQLIIKNC